MEHHVCFGGALTRREDGWYWRDGRREPRVTDLLLRHLAPNFRCITRDRTTYVEIPRHWRDQTPDDDAAAAIAALISDHGRPADIYAEGVAEAFDDHRLTYRGYLVPIAAWDAAMSAVVGCRWDTEHEADLLRRAEMAADAARAPERG